MPRPTCRIVPTIGSLSTSCLHTTTWLCSCRAIGAGRKNPHVAGKLPVMQPTTLLRAFQVERADVMGYSQGGAVVLQLAFRHPTLINKLVPMSATYRRDGSPARSTHQTACSSVSTTIAAPSGTWLAPPA
jgi:hypothetical protein